MASDRREVFVEVVVNGEVIYTESVWFSVKEDSLLEFHLNDGIYDLLGCEPDDIQDAKVEFELCECMSVECSVECQDVFVDFDMKRPTGPKDRPAEGKRHQVCICWPPEEPGSSSGTHQGGMDTTSPEEDGPKDASVCEEEPVAAEGQVSISEGMDTDPEIPEEDGPKDASVPEEEPVAAEGQVSISEGMDTDPEIPEENGPKERTKVGMMRKLKSFFKKKSALDQAEPLCVPGPSAPVAEPKENGPKESTKVGTLEKRKSLYKKKPKVHWAEPLCVSGPEPAENGPKESAIVGMMRKLKSFFKKKPALDQAEPLCVAGPSAPAFQRS